MPTDCVLCRRIPQPEVLVVLAILLLILLWLSRTWFWILLVIYGVLIGLAGIIVLALLLHRVLVKLCRKWQADPKGASAGGPAKNRRARVPATIYKRPDPLIYSQVWFSARGLAINWDNPDIKVFEVQGPGIPPKPAQPHALLPNTQYLIRARIWNGSVEAPAVNLPVRFAYLSFGIGARRQIIGETLLHDLPVKGALGLPRIAEMAWTTPAVAGHYCLQVELLWSDDADPGNNLGQTNLDVKALNSPNASFTFSVRNDDLQATPLRLAVDAYRIPAPEPCSDDRPLQERIAAHLPEANAVPAGWQVTTGWEPGTVLAPGEERSITVRVTAPDGFSGSQDININAFSPERLVGGVTLRVHS